MATAEVPPGVLCCEPLFTSLCGPALTACPRPAALRLLLALFGALAAVEFRGGAGP